MPSRDEPAEPTLGEFMEDWFRRDAVPNLAPNTIAAYLPTYRNHIRALPVDPRQPEGQTFGELPLPQFAEPYVHHDFRESLRFSGRSKPTQDAARKVLSSALSWGVESRTYRRWLPSNGAKLATTRRRRSNRATERRTEARPPRSRVLNAFDYELVRAELIARTDQRTWEPPRDAALLDLVFGCGLRPEEARGTRWWQVLWPADRADGVMRVRDVIAAGEVTEGKTVGSLRDARLPLSIAARLREWRDVASSYGLATGPQDFLIPGLASGGHVTASQEKRWGGRYLKPACSAVAEAHPARAYLVHATAYAGRRGHISSRLAAGESAPAVADDCGTSRKTIIGHYQEDLGDEFERPYPPFEEQLTRAQAEVARVWRPRAPATETLRCEAGEHDWERPRAPGPKPRSCPEHRRTLNKARGSSKKRRHSLLDGRLVAVHSGPEGYPAFVPAPLPPEPPLRASRRYAAERSASRNSSATTSPRVLPRASATRSRRRASSPSKLRRILSRASGSPP